MCYKDVVSKYAFQKPIVSVVGEEVEVSAEAVEGYCSYVEYKHGWVKNNFALHRNQITSKGAWLSRENLKKFLKNLLSHNSEHLLTSSH